jgi:hypothetical protein
MEGKIDAIVAVVLALAFVGILVFAKMKSTRKKRSDGPGQKKSGDKSKRV